MNTDIAIHKPRTLSKDGSSLSSLVLLNYEQQKDAQLYFLAHFPQTDIRAYIETGAIGYEGDFDVLSIILYQKDALSIRMSHEGFFLTPKIDDNHYFVIGSRSSFVKGEYIEGITSPKTNIHVVAARTKQLSTVVAQETSIEEALINKDYLPEYLEQLQKNAFEKYSPHILFDQITRNTINKITSFFGKELLFKEFYHYPEELKNKLVIGEECEFNDTHHMAR